VRHDHSQMTERPVVHLLLEVDLACDPIAGLVGLDDREGTPFSGWMELSRTIELTLDDARRGPRETPHSMHPEGY
jgi:hypothetical protein